MAHRRRQRAFADAEDPAGIEKGLAGTEIHAGRADVLTGGGRFAWHDGTVAGVGVLLDEDGVGAVGQRRAGEDADGLAHRDLAGKAMARRRCADDLEARTDTGVRRPDGIAVHRRSGKRRLVALGGKGNGEGAAEGVVERHGLGGKRRDAGDDLPDRLVDRKEAHLGVALKVPDLPPRFSRRRMPVISMARSTAFAMS